MVYRSVATANAGTTKHWSAHDISICLSTSPTSVNRLIYHAYPSRSQIIGKTEWRLNRERTSRRRTIYAVVIQSFDLALAFLLTHLVLLVKGLCYNGFFVIKAASCGGLFRRGRWRDKIGEYRQTNTMHYWPVLASAVIAVIATAADSHTLLSCHARQAPTSA